MTPRESRLVAIACLVAALAPASARADRRFTFGLHAGSGLSLGTGGDDNGAANVAIRRTPTFIDAELRSWHPERTDPVVGAALRLEVDGRVAAGIVPRVGIQRSLGALDLRALVGVPIFVVPFSLFGVEAGMGAAVGLGETFALVANLLLSAFVWGSDLPTGGTVVKLDLMVGIEVRP